MSLFSGSISFEKGPTTLKMKALKKIKKPLRARFRKNINGRIIRAWSGVSDGSRDVPASLTVEAALGLPLVLFAMMLLMTPFRVMNAERKMQAVCERVCMDVCEYAYTVRELKLGNKVNSAVKEAADGFGDYFESGALGGYAAVRAKIAAEDENVTITDFLETECMVENDVVTVRLDYEYRLPFSLFGIGPLTQTVVSSRRAWTGASDSGDGGTPGAEEDDQWVYIGKNHETTRTYHLDPHCSYLANDEIIAVTVTGSGNLKNSIGARYSACSVCGAAAVTVGQKVYILPGGNVYHSDPGCRAIIAYMQCVKLSTIPGYHPCVRCGG